VLANLLPGLRDVRAPLSAGFVWLLALFLALEPSLPSRNEASGVWSSLLVLADTFSPVGIGIAVSFLAYLTGSIYEAISSAIVELVGRLTSPYRFVTTGEWWRERTPRAIYSRKGEESLKEVVSTHVGALEDALNGCGIPSLQVATQSNEALAPDEILQALKPLRPLLVNRPPRADDDTFRRDFDELIARYVLTETDLMRARLIGKDTEQLFSVVDRLRSEAEFRTALAPALVALAAVLAWRATWWSAAIVTLSAVLLFWQGRQRMRASNDTLLEALRIDRVQAPTIERLDAATQELVRLPAQRLAQRAPSMASREPDEPSALPADSSDGS